jgi:hypothetical protein
MGIFMNKKIAPGLDKTFDDVFMNPEESNRPLFPQWHKKPSRSLPMLLV